VARALRSLLFEKEVSKIMSRFISSGGLLVVVASSLAFASVACSGDDGATAPLTSENALAESAASSGVPSLEQIPAGDPRCPNGGTLLKITGGSAPSESVVCNGAQGEQGEQGEQGVQGVQGIQGIQGDAGEQGEAGPQGDAGAPAPEPVLGQFLASQIVKGVVLTCATVTTQTSTVTCTGMKVNGLDARLAPAEANVICGAVTGKGYSTASGMGVVAAPFMLWNGSAWALGTGSTSPMNTIVCQR
jgi:hypothetical protein